MSYQSVSISQESDPLTGFDRVPDTKDKKKAFIIAGGTVLLLVGLLAATSNSSQVATVNANVLSPNAPLAVSEAVKTSDQGPAPAAPAPPAPAAPAPAGDDVYTSTQFDCIYNILSFGVAAQGSATVFFFFQFSLVDKAYRTALVITGLVTMIAFYHYLRIFNSFNDAFVSNNGVVTATGIPFNDAYRYVDWFLTVPLLLMELILVMGLSAEETRQRCVSLGVSAAIMIAVGYPGEISPSMTTRWIFWALAMLPFLYIVYTLFFGLRDSIAKQGSAQGLVRTACWVTVLSWCTYPVVYIFPMLGLTGYGAKTAIQVGYSVADVIAKPLLGILVWMIARQKSADVV